MYKDKLILKNTFPITLLDSKLNPEQDLSPFSHSQNTRSTTEASQSTSFTASDVLLFSTDTHALQPYHFPGDLTDFTGHHPFSH